MTEIKKRQNIAVRANTALNNMVDRLMEEAGYSTTTAVVHAGIREIYAKEFPKYIDAKRSPRTLRERAEAQEETSNYREEIKQEKQMDMCDALGGEVITSESGTKICRFFNYDRKNRYEQELPLAMLSKDLLDNQYFPSKSEVRKMQKEGLVNY